MLLPDPDALRTTESELQQLLIRFTRTPLPSRNRLSLRFFFLNSSPLLLAWKGELLSRLRLKSGWVVKPLELTAINYENVIQETARVVLKWKERVEAWNFGKLN
jgi:hypothetical protein